MQILKFSQPDFDEKFSILANRGEMDMSEVMPRVASIIAEIRKSGDKALCEQIARFDNWEPKSGYELKISTDEMERAWNSTDEKLKEALKIAYERIKAYHEKQIEKSWLSYEKDGAVLGQKITPVDRAGLYIPGGKAAYPSSLLMNAVPAIVAGVGDISVCTPAVSGEVNALLLAAMHMLGIKNAYKVGGASAVAAMAYGTDTISKVDVITGPGNIYVATAKKMVFGDVNIDMIAGPSEIGVIADSSCNAHNIAVDLLSQAEHDEIASSFLITFDEGLAKAIEAEMMSVLTTLKREKIARASVENKAAIIIARNKAHAIALANELAVEHLEIATNDAWEYLPHIKHAGAVFLGHFTPEAVGDYLAGPNHTLPTGGTARFFSPLGVNNFIKRSSVIAMNEKTLRELVPACMALASAEGLGAHELSIKVRQ